MRAMGPDRATRALGAIPVAALIALGTAVSGASAAEEGSTTASVNVAADIRSITVSPDIVLLTGCRANGQNTSGVLILPHGDCASDVNREKITVTNTGAAGHVVVFASAVQGTGADTPWTLCDGPLGPACPTSGPGVDQARVSLRNDVLGFPRLGSTPATDTSFGTTGPNAQRGESHRYDLLRLYAPSHSTSNPATRTFTVTWQTTPWIGES